MIMYILFLLCFLQYFKIHVTTMNDTNEYFFFLLFIRKILTFVSLRIDKGLYEGVIDCASVCKLHYSMSLIRS